MTQSENVRSCDSNLWQSDSSTLIANSIRTCTSLEQITKCQGTERGPTTCTSPFNHNSVRINFSFPCQTHCSIDAVIHIDNPPLAVEQATIFAAIATTPSVVDIEKCKTTRSEELDGILKCISKTQMLGPHEPIQQEVAQLPGGAENFGL